jgi:hypothetical protein
MERNIFSWADLRSETGSNVAQSSGVALAAAILITTILTLTPMLSSQVEQAFLCLAGALGGGGGGCASGSASASLGGAFQVTTARLPDMPRKYNLPLSSRHLRPEERALAVQLFGPGALDLDKITITSLPWVLRGRAYTEGNIIYWPAYEEKDTKVLAHELTHVYQFQKRGWVYWREAAKLQIRNWTSGFDPYDYGEAAGLQQARSEGKTFADFTVEQQGQIVEDYYALWRDHHDTSAYDPFIRDARLGLLDRP